METGNVPDRSNNISVSIGLQNVMDRYGTDQNAIRYNGNIVLVSIYLVSPQAGHTIEANCVKF